VSTTSEERQLAWVELDRCLQVMAEVLDNPPVDMATIKDAALMLRATARDLRKACEEREAELAEACVAALGPMEQVRVVGYRLYDEAKDGLRAALGREGAAAAVRMAEDAAKGGRRHG
jgi:hypothetical protein